MRRTDDSSVDYAPDRRSPTPAAQGCTETLRLSGPPSAETPAAGEDEPPTGDQKRFVPILLRALSAWTV